MIGETEDLKWQCSANCHLSLFNLVYATFSDMGLLLFCGQTEEAGVWLTENWRSKSPELRRQ